MSRDPMSRSTVSRGAVAGGKAGWLRRLTRQCWRHRAALITTWVCAVTGMTINALTPLLPRVIIDDVIIARSRPMLPWAGLMLLAGIAAYLLLMVRRRCGARMTQEVTHDLRTAMFTSLTRLDGAGQDSLEIGQVIGRNTSDLTRVQNLLTRTPTALGGLVALAVSLGAMVVLSPRLTAVALVTLPVLGALSLTSRVTLFPASWYAQQQEAAVAGVVAATVFGVRVVKGFGQEERELNRLEAVAARLFAHQLRVVRIDSRFAPSIRAVPSLGQIAMLAFGGALAVHGQLSLGTFIAFATYLTRINQPIRNLVALVTLAQQARASAERIFEVIDTGPTVVQRPDAADLDVAENSDVAEDPADGPAKVRPAQARPVPGAAAVEFDDVSFGYQDGRPVLDGFRLAVAPGETVALVGRSGSGKSTVAALLSRFYDPSAGVVRVYGHDVRDLTLTSLRGLIGVVGDDGLLFSTSLWENIAYGCRDAPTATVLAAARASRVDEFATDLPEGYRTRVGERGLTLSGGQRQRVAIARAIVADTPVLVLDDATSAIDAEVEAEIHRELRTVTSTRTTLLIAHRRATLRLADRIGVVEQGRILDIGTHDELIARCAAYRDLITPDDPADQDDPGDQGDPGDFAAPRPREPTEATTPTETPVPDIQAAAVPELEGLPAALRRRVLALPPALDTPDLDQEVVRARDPRFGLAAIGRLLWASLTIAWLLLVIDSLTTLALPILIRHGIDEGVTARSLPVVLGTAGVGVAVIAVSWSAHTAQIRVVGRLGARVGYLLRVKLFAHLQRLGLDFYEREASGRVMTRLTSDVDQIADFMRSDAASSAVSVLTALGIAIALVVIDPGLALAVFALVPPLVIGTVFFRGRAARAHADARESLAELTAELQENVTAMRVVQAFRREPDTLDRYRDRSATYRDQRLRAVRYLAYYFPYIQLLSTAASVAVLLVGSGRVHAGTLTIGALAAYLLYIELFFAPIQDLAEVFDEYQAVMVALGHARELMAVQPVPADTPHARPVERLRGEISLTGAGFTYPGSATAALREVNVTIPAGQTVALVGRTGSGKSTLTKIIARYYDLTEGTLRVDGVDVRGYALADYRRRLGPVPQEAHLFAGTVRDAIAYGRPDAPDEQVRAAARTAGAEEMIAGLPGGYGYRVRDQGRNLSAGQRQLLALARAHLVGPDILLLDEATAALDLASEAAVARAAAEVGRSRTTVVVAHRLTTAARADRVLVLDGGRLVEDGTHGALMAAGGHYARLWAAYAHEHRLDVS
ncbi:ABC transporter related [Parafrankia sp. Ea1.12]|nr:ABC transporter related [Parafrankia sp. Ea1.12]